MEPYQSRLHLTNGLVSLAVDAKNGEILEFTNEKTWDNVMKNFLRCTRTLLDGIVWQDGIAVRFFVPRYAEIRKDDTLSPTIRLRQGDGDGVLELGYPALVSAAGARLKIRAEIRITLPKDDCRTVWELTLTNDSGDEITDVAFPALCGMWLGDTWEDDELALPRVAGILYKNPCRLLSSPGSVTTWKWQEYLHRYRISEEPGKLDDRGVYALEVPYTGGGSMLWADLFDREEGSGIYFTCRNDGFRKKSIRAETCGFEDPGVGLAVVHKLSLRTGSWTAEKCVVALHAGDWHWAADDYRAWRGSVPAPVLKQNPVPEWFRKSPGLVAHYDFQYQGGGIVHTFRDIPALYEKAKSMGFSHLLLSGWHEGGFDFGFPQYTPGHRLGTPQDLADAVREVRKRGGHVAFYLNSRICNTGLPGTKERLRKSAVLDRNGNMDLQNYGASDAMFASLCTGDPEWRAELSGCVHNLLSEIGADSVYLDQLAMTRPLCCYHPGHTEHAGDPNAWNQGYEKLLAQIREADPDAAILYEGCCDIFGQGVAAQLISTLRRSERGTEPAIYQYTFPDQILTDMLNPRRNSGMRAESVARRAGFFLAQAFVNGFYFWVYDLEWDNTFDRDPESMVRLKAYTRLRSAWLERYGKGRFCDTVGILSAPSAPLVRRYELEDGILISAASPAGAPLSGTVTAEIPTGAVVSAEEMTFADPAPRALSVRVRSEGGKFFAEYELPETEAAVCRIVCK